MLIFKNRILLQIAGFLQWRLPNTGFLLLIGTLLSGCGHNHLYDKTNDTIAKETKEAVKKVDFVSIINQERVNTSKLLSREQEVVHHWSVSMRNTAIRALLEDSIKNDGSKEIEPLSDKLERFINDRRIALGYDTSVNNTFSLSDRLELYNKEVKIIKEEETLPKNIHDYWKAIQGYKEEIKTTSKEFKKLLTSATLPEYTFGLRYKKNQITKEKYEEYKLAAPNCLKLDELLASIIHECRYIDEDVYF